ncbi:MAG: multiheme c-type cytochrome [Arenicellales bacterium]
MTKMVHEIPARLRQLGTPEMVLLGMMTLIVAMLPFTLCAQTEVESVAETADVFLGSHACKNCHEPQYKKWQESDHFRAMEDASVQSVIGDFSGKEMRFHGVAYRFYRDGDKFFTDIEEPGPQAETFEIKYTYGYSPLQQYLVELDQGFIQALNVAWDDRPQSDGGQRWFHLQPDEDITPDHPFHWKNHFMNWNSRCADCHSTNVERNYDQQTHSFNTTWSEITVGCEACHGPGASHVQRIEAGTYSGSNTGFLNPRPDPVKWVINEGDPIANPQGEKSDHHIDMCGACHSLRTQLSAKSFGDSYHNSNRIQLVSTPSYHADGQINEEVYVLGSFMQSKMYAQGVTCTNCHDPHSGKLIAQDNALCAQCHLPSTYDSTDHHQHKTDSDGAKCVSCHMPETTYMQVDNRRDHSFSIPRPELSLDLDVPNACVQCHIGRSDAWAIETLQGWGAKSTREHWAYLSASAQDGDVLVTRPLTNLLKENSLPLIVQASLLAQLSSIPSRVSIETAQQQLEHESPVVRRAAVEAIQNAPVELRWEILSPYFSDPERSVRFEIVANLVRNYPDLFPEQQKQLEPLIDEYGKMLLVSTDSPATQMAIANLALGQRKLAAAEKALLHALRIEPGYIPAMINLADYYRSLGRENEVEPLLKRALEIAPDSGAVNHTYGLHLIRKQDYAEALTYLENAISAEDASPRFAYVYAIALENTGDTASAVEVLKNADSRWPNQYEILLTLVNFLDKAGQTSALYPYLSALSKIAPSSPDVQHFVQKYGN